MKEVFGCGVILLALLQSAAAQQSPQQKKVEAQASLNINAQATATVKQPTVDYLQTAAKSSVFIYDGGAKPCDPVSAGMPLLPSGSGFVVGIGKKGHPPDQWRGWKFLITAAHVIGNRSDIVVRLMHLIRGGGDQNVFLDESNESDLIAIYLPDIGETDPTVFGYSMLLDEPRMAEWDIKTGTNVFGVGYLYGYSGQTENYPVTKFGKISVLTKERWYVNPETHRSEQAYIVELQGTPGLSGAPLMTYGVEIGTKPFRYREFMPYVVGIIKGGLFVPVSVSGTHQWISQGLVTVEPAEHIRELLRSIADRLKAAGANVEFD